ncbi:Diuretic hormone receptor [Gryllus bimaculatus]|nr:Diuretic hormone receptor [Gryllus bimaculatus]
MQGPMDGVAGHGFTVALFYCFLNTEVQNTLRHRMSRWRETRTVGGGRRYTLSGHSKDWSPRSRTESIRLGDLPYGGSLLGAAGGSPYHKRESTASATTTTTLLGPPAGKLHFNASDSTQ